ncbi:MAG: Rab family GTPase [Candidatus Hodarchaeales archaeon]|jgi:small GTP-binding protein
MEEFREDNTPIFKLLIVGEQGVGKSTLIKKYVDGVFDANMKSTLGVDFSLKTVVGTDRKFVLQIWDIAGEERFRDVLPSYVPGTKSCILCFDSTDPISTLEKLSNWISVITNAADIPNITFILISTKNDLKQLGGKFSSTIRSFRKKYPIIRAYLSTSSKTGTNVENVFQLVSSLLIEEYGQKQ